MSIKGIWKSNVYKYSEDTFFEHRFASYTESELKLWTEALYNNEIIFKGSDKKYYIPDFKQIDFRGPEVDHPEWVQQQNRFRWLLYATAEYSRTGSEHMADLVYDAVNAWMEYWPYYGDRTDIYPFRQHEFWDPMISTPIRLGFGKGCGWVGCLPEFFDHPLFTEEFVNKVYKSILWQLKPMIYNNMEKGGEHNWRPNELDCLLFVSSVLPDAGNHLAYAVENLNDTFDAQFENDGSHIEHTPDYHGWLTEAFVNIYLLGKNRPELGLKIDTEKLIKAINYAIDSRTPDRRSFGIHDSWPWHLNNEPADYKFENMLAKILEYNKGFDINGPGTGPDSQYPDAGQYFFGNNGSPDSTRFYFDATRWGSWHCHLSCNSVNLYHKGRMLLIDTGSLDYGKNEIRNYGKFSTSHNTVIINGLSQCLYANPEVLEKCLNEKVALIVSSYQGGYQDPEGYGRPVPAEHERIFIWVRDRFAIVFDNINQYNNKRKNHISCHWQLPEGQVCHKENEKCVNTLFEDSNLFLKCIYSQPDTRTVIHEGETNPLLGYISRTGGKMSGGKPAPMFSSEVCTDAEFTRFCHLIVPYDGTRVPCIETSYERTRYAMKFNITIDDDKYEVASHYFVREYFKTNSAIREIGNIKTFSKVMVRGVDEENKIFEWKYK